LRRHGLKRLDITNAASAVDLAEYDDSWFSVVTETDFRTKPSRITERFSSRS
jgi:hypothetical protein